MTYLHYLTVKGLLLNFLRHANACLKKVIFNSCGIELDIIAWQIMIMMAVASLSHSRLLDDFIVIKVHK